MVDELLLENGRIYSSSGNYHSWMIIKDNKIFKLGSGDIKWDGKSIDLEENLVLPGLHDSHIHVYSLGRMESRLMLKGVGSIAELKGKLADFAENNEFEWIIGHGWDQDYMEDNRYPTKEDIDDIVPDKPVLLYRGCNHIGLVNSKALEVMGIDSTTPDPEGGQIDMVDSIPTGILRENALDMVNSYIKPLEEENRLEYFKQGIQACLQAGITSVHTNDSDAWKYYSKLEETGDLPIRVFLTIPFSEIDDPTSPSFEDKQGLLECRRIKLFADGSLGAETAALREPYNGSDNRGILIQPPEELFKKIALAHQRGYQLEVHAIGDRAVELVIEGFKAAKIDKSDRPIITHCQVLGEDLINEIREKQYIANIQPPFVPTDAIWAEKRLGDKPRFEYSYAWKTLLNENVPVSGGSDAPIEVPDPFYGIYCAIMRPGPKGEKWKPQECLSFDEAIKIYTRGGAYAVGKEKSLGQLKAGMLADFVIINPLILDQYEHLTSNPVKQVWVNGKRRL